MNPRSLLVATCSFLLGVPAAAQTPQGPPPQGQATPATQPAEKTSLSPVKFDPATGYPVLGNGPATRPGFLGSPQAKSNQPPAAPAAEVRSAPRSTAVVETAGSRTQTTPLASGMEFGSPLLDLYQRVGAPGMHKALAGRTIWWRLSVYGAQGEVIGRREVTHTLDCAFAERDRLEYGDGRVYGRSGRAVFAEKNGMPWLTLNEAAEAELALFGLHARLPWLFADAVTFAVVARDNLTIAGDAVCRCVVERRPPAALEIVGPVLDPKPRDRFEVLYDPTSGLPRQFVHRFASSLQQRRVLLEDWHELDGVQVPYRRIYVDDDERQTTMLEILRIEPARVTERTFRLH